MILGNVRASLTRNDAQLALRLICRGSATELESAEEALRGSGIDALLDDPRLLPALMESRLGMNVSLPLFCYVVVRCALRAAGENDRALADYVAAILLHFGARGRAERIAESDDQTYDTVSALLDEVNGADARRTFLVRQHLGNYALWLSGLFPDLIEQRRGRRRLIRRVDHGETYRRIRRVGHVWLLLAGVTRRLFPALIEKRRWRRGGPDLEYYEDMGRRGFQLAADHRLAQEHGLDTLFRDVAERFPRLRVALNGVSDTLFFPSGSSPERLMRQVRDEVRWKLT